jgi:hypothetical protein
MTDYTKDEFIKETGLSEKDVQELKEAFVEKYASLKGWDSDNLTQEQLSEIYQQEEYKKAGLLFS